MRTAVRPTASGPLPRRCPRHQIAQASKNRPTKLAFNTGRSLAEKVSASDSFCGFKQRLRGPLDRVAHIRTCGPYSCDSYCVSIEYRFAGMFTRSAHRRRHELGSIQKHKRDLLRSLRRLSTATGAPCIRTLRRGVLQPMLRAASESAIVAVKFRPHRQCRMAVSGPLGRVKTGLGGYGDSFGQLASGKAYALIAPLKTGKTNACGRGLAARTRTFEIKLIFG